MAITKEDDLKQLKVLETSYAMYEDTKKATEKRMKSALNPDGKKKYTEADIKEEIALIEESQTGILAKYELFGGDPNELIAKFTKKKSGKKANTAMNVDANAIYEQRIAEQKANIEKAAETETTIEKKDVAIDKDAEYIHTTFDVIPLPSKGECYKQKLGRLPVAYLTAYDENMIIAPNLYRDNQILDKILEHKILNNTIDVMDMLEGDRDAVILFLRASGYGNEYPITAVDKVTGAEFETTFDLSTLKYKEFKLEGDANGWFNFELPVSKKVVKFKFLSHGDNLKLQEMEDMESKKVMKEKLTDMVDVMDEYIEHDDTIENAQKIKIRQAIRTIDDWKEGMDEDDALSYTHSITNRLEMAIQAVDDVTDPKYIREFVMNMNVRDSSALRKYMAANEPGIDYNIQIQKPESLGGGSMEVFLQLDQYIFLNIA